MKSLICQRVVLLLCASHSLRNGWIKIISSMRRNVSATDPMVRKAADQQTKRLFQKPKKTQINRMVFQKTKWLFQKPRKTQPNPEKPIMIMNMIMILIVIMIVIMRSIYILQKKYVLTHIQKRRSSHPRSQNRSCIVMCRNWMRLFMSSLNFARA